MSIKTNPLIKIAITPFSREDRVDFLEILKPYAPLGYGDHNGRPYLTLRAKDFAEIEALCLGNAFADRVADTAFDSKDHTLKRFNIIQSEPGLEDKLGFAFSRSLLVKQDSPDGVSTVFARAGGLVRKSVLRFNIPGITIQEVH